MKRIGVDIAQCSDDVSPQRFKSLRRISEGAFGDVKLGIDTHTGKKVAMKYVRLSSHGIPRAVFREIEALKQCKHDRIVDLIDVYPFEINLVMVFEFMSSDLQHEISRSSTYLSPCLIKYYSLMILQGLSHCHSLGIVHRDIKPSNILVSSNGSVKIADFGLARALDLSSSDSLSHQVATRWYRAIELLFGSRHYAFSVDMWSVGTVIAELVMMKPLFPGNNDLDQIYKVFQITGTPDETDWPEVKDLPDFGKVCFPVMRAVALQMFMPQASQELLGFIQEFIHLNPNRRTTAEQACAHPYLRDAPLTHPSIDDNLAHEGRSGDDSGGGRLSALVSAAKQTAGREALTNLLESVIVRS